MTDNSHLTLLKTIEEDSLDVTAEIVGGKLRRGKINNII